MKLLTPVAASILALVSHAQAQDVIDAGNGFGTYYYDIEQVQACGTDFSNQNLGFVECNYNTGLSLNEIDSNYVVAMNHTQIAADLAYYCGKGSSLPSMVYNLTCLCSLAMAVNDVAQAPPPAQFGIQTVLRD